MNKNVKNVILIMSGGSGQRFGAPVPKQYCMMGGREIISYAIDAARFCSSTDEVVIVTAKDYLDSVREKYGFPTTLGGANRTESLANGLAYIAENYACEKVIIANAVCPLMTEEQLDRYFKLLDDYDYVLTSWKVVSTLHRYDGTCVDRNDYFHVMEPEAYRFRLLYDNYKKDYPVPYNFHQLPKTARGFYCFDYPYTMKITHTTDVKVAQVLYDELIATPKQEKIKQAITAWLSSFSSEGVSAWIVDLPRYIYELQDKWQITSWTMNPKTFATCVLEAESRIHGSVILKFHAPRGQYELELAYYLNTTNPRMAQLLDHEDRYRALLIKKIVPGMQVPFDAKDEDLRAFYDAVHKNLIPANEISGCVHPLTIISDFEKNAEKSNRFNFHLDSKKSLDSAARELYKRYFSNCPMYFLHRDFHRRNILRQNGSGGGCRAIDPLGIIGPVEFEYTISFIIEARANPKRIAQQHKEMIDYFTKYCDRDRLVAAVFIQWVHKMDEYVFAKNDGGMLAEWCFEAIRKLFFNGEDIPGGCVVLPKLDM